MTVQGLIEQLSDLPPELEVKWGQYGEELLPIRCVEMREDADNICEVIALSNEDADEYSDGVEYEDDDGLDWEDWGGEP